MSFSMITDIIRQNGKAVRAYETAAAAAREAAIAEPGRSIGYFLLGAAAADFAELHYGEAIHTTFFDEALVRFEGYTKALDTAFADPDPQLRLDALCAISQNLILYRPSDDHLRSAS
jgi:N-carbamoyl-L-amino-acid hydrolase